MFLIYTKKIGTDFTNHETFPIHVYYTPSGREGQGGGEGQLFRL